MVTSNSLSEINFQQRLYALIDQKRLEEIKIKNSTSEGVNCLADLVGTKEFVPCHESQGEKWRRCYPEVGMDLVGGRTRPDIIISSVKSGEQRVVIEVKKHATFTHKEPSASQIARYFLYLVYASRQNPLGRAGPDIRRAVLLAAPRAWFSPKQNKEESAKLKIWRETVRIYKDLAGLRGFDITFGEIHEEDLPDVLPAEI